MLHLLVGSYVLSVAVKFNVWSGLMGLSMSNVPGRQARLVSGQLPVMRETRYDHTSSVVIAAALVLIGSVILLISIWLSNLLPDRPNRKIEILAAGSAVDDGVEEEPLQVESPEDPSDDPSLSNDQQETQLEEVMDRLISVAGQVTQLKLPNDFRDATSGGSLGSSVGSIGSPLGAGGRGSGASKENRWTVEFAERGSLSLYAKQLDFFGIELGVVFKDGRVIYVSQLSSTMRVREARIDSGDPRLFMSWQDGDRVKADLALLKKAGVSDAARGQPLHFYSAETESLLARLEKEYAERPVEQIRRTKFRVIGEPGTFQFVVAVQKYR